MSSTDRRRDRRPAAPRTWEYTVGGVWRVLAGRSGRDNDQLSLKVARANDWWFHVRGMPGSHVVLQCTGQGEPDKTALEEAAAIAAYHSKAREGGTVPVSATRARYVTKVSGAPPGTVNIRKESVFKVRPSLPSGIQQEERWN